MPRTAQEQVMQKTTQHTPALRLIIESVGGDRETKMETKETDTVYAQEAATEGRPHRHMLHTQ